MYVSVDGMKDPRAWLLCCLNSVDIEEMAVSPEKRQHAGRVPCGSKFSSCKSLLCTIVTVVLNF